MAPYVSQHTNQKINCKYTDTDQGLYSQRFLFLELVLFLEFFLELSFFWEKF